MFLKANNQKLLLHSSVHYSLFYIPSGPNGFEFELLGGCREFGKSLDIAYQTTRNINP